MKKNKFKLLTLIIMSSMLSFASCGGDDDDVYVNNGTDEQQEEEQTDQGNYDVVMVPLNTNVVSANAQGNFTIEGDEFNAIILIRDSMATQHIQHIHVGTRCPVSEDDTNSDGYIDAIEVKAAVGEAIVPLDDDLSSQSNGENFPNGPFINYSESTSYTSMMADLHLPDTNTSDEVIKLELDENLNLEGKTILIHGVSPSTELPNTVQTNNGLTPQESLPILCGVITRAETDTTGGTTTGTANSL